MKKSFHTVKKAGILTAAAVLGTTALAGCGSKADTTESAAASEAATEAAGEAEASDAQLVIAGGDSAGLIAAVQAAAEGMDPSKILILAPGEELAADMTEMAPYVNAADTDEQFQANLTDDFEIYLSDIMTAGNNTNNSDMAAYVSENSEEAKDENGYSITKEGETASMELIYDKDLNTWNVVADGVSTELLQINNDGTAQMTLPNGEDLTVTLDAQGVSAARQATMVNTYYAAR